jgi:hypothetical protein
MLLCGFPARAVLPVHRALNAGFSLRIRGTVGVTVTGFAVPCVVHTGSRAWFARVTLLVTQPRGTTLLLCCATLLHGTCRNCATVQVGT